MGAVWDALAIFLTITFAVGFVAADFYLQYRRRRNAWKKPPRIPQQRGPQGMTRGGRELLMAAYQLPAPAPTEVRKDVA